MTLTSPGSRVRKLKTDHIGLFVTSLAIGDNLAFAGLPCEPFVDIGRAIKKRSPFRTTIITCLFVTSLAIGDNLAFAGLPCEPFVDIGRAIKKRSPFRTTIITCLTNDSVGYIASTKAHADGGYEGLSSWLAAPTGDLLVDAQVKQLTSLKGNSKGDAPNNPKP